MILLKDLFALLATGEFSNMALKKTNNNVLEESEYGKVIGHINLGLVEIYKRISLIEEEISLHVTTTKSVYLLRPKYATISNNLNDQRYIEVPDDHDGYLNIIEIKDIFDADSNRLTMNNRFKTPYIRQVSEDTLKITGLTADQVLSVIFQAHPSPIVLDDDFDIEIYALNIPKTIIEALLYFVASRVYKPIGANNSTANADKSQSYQQQYELSCQKLEIYGLDINDDNNDPDNFTRQGWV